MQLRQSLSLKIGFLDFIITLADVLFGFVADKNDFLYLYILCFIIVICGGAVGFSGIIIGFI